LQTENVILKKSSLAEDIINFKIFSPVIAGKAKAGQFVVIKANESGERIPLTIADSIPSEGIIDLTVLKRGKTTNMLMTMNEGEVIQDIAGPLGKKSEIENFGNVFIIGGGVGIAPTYPIIKAMKIAGNYVISVLGARNRSGLIFEEEISRFSDEFFVCTDDGSKGYNGFVSGFLSEYLDNNPEKIINRVIAIGPALMMKAVCDITEPYKIKTIVSLNPIMVDGTGMCGSCRVEVAGRTEFACVDGPEFDGHFIDFKLLISRLNIYCEEEKESLTKFMESHKCKMNL